MSEPEIESLLPLTPAGLHILLALADHEQHGYAIMRAVAQDTGGAMRLGPATLYRSIKTLLGLGLIAERAERADPALDDERRRYYHLTDWGRRVAQAEVARLDALVALARRKPLLQDAEPLRLAGGP